jgi:hypothetical protein
VFVSRQDSSMQAVLVHVISVHGAAFQIAALHFLCGISLSPPACNFEYCACIHNITSSPHLPVRSCSARPRKQARVASGGTEQQQLCQLLAPLNQPQQVDGKDCHPPRLLQAAAISAQQVAAAAAAVPELAAAARNVRLSCCCVCCVCCVCVAFAVLQLALQVYPVLSTNTCTPAAVIVTAKPGAALLEQYRAAGKPVPPSVERMAAMLDAMEAEGGGDAPLVKPGDASMASPFTAKADSVAPVLDVLKQGRCTLVTTVQARRIAPHRTALLCLLASERPSSLYLPLLFSCYFLSLFFF